MEIRDNLRTTEKPSNSWFCAIEPCHRLSTNNSYLLTHTVKKSCLAFVSSSWIYFRHINLGLWLEIILIGTINTEQHGMILGPVAQATGASYSFRTQFMTPSSSWQLGSAPQWLARPWLPWLQQWSVPLSPAASLHLLGPLGSRNLDQYLNLLFLLNTSPIISLQPCGMEIPSPISFPSPYMSCWI